MDLFRTEILHKNYDILFNTIKLIFDCHNIDYVLIWYNESMDKDYDISQEDYDYLGTRSSNGQKYFFECHSLLYELKKLELDNKSESGFWSTLLGKDLSKETRNENYVFYIKNSIYRIYDLVNKLAQMIGRYYEIPKLKKWSKFSSLEKPLCQKIPEELRESISIAFKSTTLVEVLVSRHSMTHNQLVETRKDYISHWVLPIGGENAKDFETWEIESQEKIIETVGMLEKLFSEAVVIITKEQE